VTLKFRIRLELDLTRFWTMWIWTTQFRGKTCQTWSPCSLGKFKSNSIASGRDPGLYSTVFACKHVHIGEKGDRDILLRYTRDIWGISSGVGRTTYLQLHG